jgi:NTE family protein
VNRAVVVLSGGGAKTAAHCGAVKALVAHGITPVRYVATSMGAVVAAALAAGTDPDVVVRSLAQEARSGLRPHPLAAVAGTWLPGLLRAAPFRAALGRMVPARQFADLSVPLTITAVDVDRIELVLLGAGGLDVPLLDALMATCALPPWLPAVELEGHLLRDGGLLGHVPLDAIGPTEGLPVIAVDVGPGLDQGKEPKAAQAGPPLVRAMDESLGILMAQGGADQLARWRNQHGGLVYVRPRVERGATFRVDRARVYAEEGYLAMRAALDALGPAR